MNTNETTIPATDTLTVPATGTGAVNSNVIKVTPELMMREHFPVEAQVIGFVEEDHRLIGTSVKVLGVQGFIPLDWMVRRNIWLNDQTVVTIEDIGQDGSLLVSQRRALRQELRNLKVGEYAWVEVIDRQATFTIVKIVNTHLYVRLPHSEWPRETDPSQFAKGDCLGVNILRAYEDEVDVIVSKIYEQWLVASKPEFLTKTHQAVVTGRALRRTDKSFAGINVYVRKYGLHGFVPSGELKRAGVSYQTGNELQLQALRVDAPDLILSESRVPQSVTVK